MRSYRFRVLLETQSFLWILSEEAFDEVFEFLRRVLREANNPLADDIVELAFGVSVVGRTAHIKLVKHDAELVPVDHAIVATFIDDLEREIGGSAAERFVERVKVVGFLGKAEVS